VTSCGENHNEKKDEKEALAPGEVRITVYPDSVLPLEAQLYLPIHEVDSLEGLGLIDSVKYFIKTNNKPLDKLVAEIDTAHFNFLLDMVVSHTTSCGGDPYVSAVRMTFGLHGDSVIPVYQPILLCKTKEETSAGV